MMTDPVADMLTRLRNASRIERPIVEMPATRLKCRVAQVLKDEGCIHDYQLGKHVSGETGGKDFQVEANPDLGAAHLVLRLFLKYGPDGSLTLYFGAESPGKGKETNWVPAPDGTFSLYIRAYWADKAILDGTWTPPNVEKVE